jgi:hypothetical protein
MRKSQDFVKGKKPKFRYYRATFLKIKNNIFIASLHAKSATAT